MVVSAMIFPLTGFSYSIGEKDLLDKANSYALANLGGELMGSDDARALKCLDRALSINPRLFYARLHRSKVLLDMGDVL